jgi:hypothetical protein
MKLTTVTLPNFFTIAGGVNRFQQCVEFITQSNFTAFKE